MRSVPPAIAGGSLLRTISSLNPPATAGGTDKADETSALPASTCSFCRLSLILAPLTNNCPSEVSTRAHAEIDPLPLEAPESAAA